MQPEDAEGIQQGSGGDLDHGSGSAKYFGQAVTPYSRVERVRPVYMRAGLASSLDDATTPTTAAIGRQPSFFVNCRFTSRMPPRVCLRGDDRGSAGSTYLGCYLAVRDALTPSTGSPYRPDDGQRKVGCSAHQTKECRHVANTSPHCRRLIAVTLAASPNY